MTSITLTARLGRRSALGRSVVADVGIAGGLLFGAGAIALLGIITAEALYPALYTTAGNEISDLGGTRPPGGLVYQPSATIFNATMLVTGLMTLMGAVVTHGAFRRWLVALPIAVLGGAVVGVALFPGNTGAPHAVLAMVAFISGGVAAVLSASRRAVALSGPPAMMTASAWSVAVAVLTACANSWNCCSGSAAKAKGSEAVRRTPVKCSWNPWSATSFARASTSNGVLVAIPNRRSWPSGVCAAE